MYKVKARKDNRDRRKAKVRSKIIGTLEKPRMSVFRSNKYIFAQLIDDTAGETLISFSSNSLKGNKVSQSLETGKKIAELAIKKGIKQVVFDRNGYRYHGRIKNLADGAREGGLKL